MYLLSRTIGLFPHIPERSTGRNASTGTPRCNSYQRVRACPGYQLPDQRKMTTRRQSSACPTPTPAVSPPISPFTRQTTPRPSTKPHTLSSSSSSARPSPADSHGPPRRIPLAHPDPPSHCIRDTASPLFPLRLFRLQVVRLGSFLGQP